jgi:hypothetical protein
MKSIHIYIEYILIILLSVFTFYFVFTWWNNNKIYAIDFYNQNKFQYDSKYIENVLRNLQDSLYFNINFNLDGYNIYCLNNLTLIKSNNFCKTTLNNLTYQGELIYSYGNYYVYDPKMNGYYLLENNNNITLYGCFENYLSLIILTNNCTGVCYGNCNLNIVKNKTFIYSIIK